MDPNIQGYLQRKFAREAGEKRGVSGLPIRTKESQDTDNLPDRQHLVLIEYRIANRTLGTRLLSMGVLLIHESNSYIDLLAAIKGKSKEWENVPLVCREKSIAVRWKIGQAISDDSYDTLCGPDVDMNGLILMMRERHWKDRLVVVYHAEENDGSDSSKSSESSDSN
ncbi:uncharacterized protein EAF01_005602 [Botrytis porri]|uniref:Uncharacterized protein n=1 Tax=Botrytis porri TaxID=87229 RepID=A0A4Z1KQY5_9HELO|nr:uncharacterized protein EAF01_005602 [Botrytis porri]KAF7905081.1 hypothetical protein EAF01_005602 [Botrytis porri]TGO87292.1 hypothetical protein BPOR_0236g00150 [Botrytis porri]